MALKTKTVTVQEDGRDQGKTFFITELPARQAEKLGQKMAAALLRAMQGDTRLQEEALDEELRCVQYVPAPNIPPRQLVDSDVEELSTLKMLRGEVADLHYGFFAIENLSRLTSGLEPQGPSNTQTSGESSGP